MFAAACDGSSKDDSDANGDDGSGDDGKADDGKGDDGTPGGDAGPGGDGGGPGGDGGGPGGDGGGPGGDGGGDAGPGGDDGGGGVSWDGGFGAVLLDGNKILCNMLWWQTSGTGSSVTCAGCDYTYDIDAPFDNSNCFKEDKGDDNAYTNAHKPDAYEYNGNSYDLMYLTYDDGANWYFGGFVIYGGSGSGYVQYFSPLKNKYYGYDAAWFGYGTYH
jgi:hypothetical protein